MRAKQAGEMMRSVLGQAAVVGFGVAAAVLIIRAQLGAEPLHVQLLAVLCAGLVLGGFQLALGRRFVRANRLSPRRKDTPPHTLALPAPPRQFQNDGDNGWTGLAAAPARPPHDHAPTDAPALDPTLAPHEPPPQAPDQ